MDAQHGQRQTRKSISRGGSLGACKSCFGSGVPDKGQGQKQIVRRSARRPQLRSGHKLVPAVAAKGRSKKVAAVAANPAKAAKVAKVAQVAKVARRATGANTAKRASPTSPDRPPLHRDARHQDFHAAVADAINELFPQSRIVSNKRAAELATAATDLSPRQASRPKNIITIGNSGNPILGVPGPII